MPEVSELQQAENWLHAYPFIMKVRWDLEKAKFGFFKIGRTSPIPPPPGEEEKEENKEEVVELLKGIADDAKGKYFLGESGKIW